MKVALTAMILVFSIGHSFSQGCSDAGFCTMGSSQTTKSIDSLYRQHFKMTLSYGAAEQGVAVIQTVPELELSFFNNNTIQLKLPFSFISGNLGDTKGAGDVAISISQRLINTTKNAFSFSAGIKLPTGNTDLTSNDTASLPMPYQTGLGTIDLVIGAAWNYKNWQIATGYQKVLKQDNRNTFLRSRYPENGDADSYFESNLLERGDDVLLRIEKKFEIKKLILTPGVLGIYRLKEDKIIAISGNKVSLNGSDGLTLNLTASATWLVSDRFDLQLQLGAPAIVREVRPDGLTRSFVMNIGFRYNFNFSK